MAGLLATGVPENTAKSAASRLVANRGKSTSTSNKTGHNLFLSANEVSNYLPFDPLRAGKYQSIFTVHGRNTGLDPRVAPPGLLQMLPIALNAYGLSGDIGTILPNGIRFPTHLYRPTKSDTATIQSEAISDNSSSRAIQQWIILMKPSDEYPFTLLEQNYGLSLERTANQNSENLPQC